MKDIKNTWKSEWEEERPLFELYQSWASVHDESEQEKYGFRA
ncbi:hypothetical protein BOO71_0000001 [Deinococcus marmoris]|uniref:Uncharacterized protein n=1 Tax=Deinococcus marmoris TaxID=249408 RepID=A0A1U7P5A6_9DEIO|nr:hypothetical protein BOO71_0000001 [Deinococcus marmoris]